MKAKFIQIISTSVLILVLTNANLASKSCPKAYSHCNLGKDGYINVHVVSHTHDDVGWLKTIDQYYYGSNNAYQDAAVQYIIGTCGQTIFLIYENDKNEP